MAAKRKAPAQSGGTSSRGAVGPSVVGQQPRNDIYAQRLGSLLTPSKVASILRNADGGYTAAWHDLLNEVRQKSPILQGLLGARENALTSRPWCVHPWKAQGELDATDEDEAIAAFVQDALTRICGFERAVSHWVDAVYKSFSVCETEWVKRPDGYIVPRKLHPVHGRRWAITPGQTIRLYDGGQRMSPDGSDMDGAWGTDVIAANPMRFVVHAPRINGDNLSREGLGRCLIWFEAFAVWAWRDWMLFAELFGKPNRRAVYDPEVYQDATDDSLKTALDMLISSGVTIHSKALDIITEWPQGGKTDTSPSPSIIDKAAAWQSIAVLGQRATIAEVTNGLGGSGDARDLVRKDILKADNDALAETIRDQLIEPMVRLNFGPNANVPHFSWDIAEAVDVLNMATALDTAVNKLRLPVSARAAYEKLGIAEPVEGEELVMGAPAPAPAAGAATAPDANSDGA